MTAADLLLWLPLLALPAVLLWLVMTRIADWFRRARVEMEAALDESEPGLPAVPATEPHGATVIRLPTPEEDEEEEAEIRRKLLALQARRRRRGLARPVDHGEE